jgi:carboxyl-terminal processing protease
MKNQKFFNLYNTKMALPRAFKYISLAFLTLLLFSNSVFASSVKGLKEQQIDEILFNIHTYYVEDLALQNSRLIEYNHAQFQRLYSKLDPYSKYLDENELNAIFDDNKGQYTGIGIEVNAVKEHTTIINVIANSPADKAGIKSGDIILSVNNVPVKSKPIEDIASLIRDANSATLNMGIKRAQYTHPINVDVKREQISLHSVTSKLLDSGTGYLAISRFSNHTLHDVALNIADLKSHYGYPLKGLVIDLRNNPGGMLQSAVSVSDLFLQSGTIVTTKGRYFDANQAYYAKSGDILKGAPIVVLINEKSASAAEILAAALKDNNRATIVGSQSFGKGSVQSLIPLGEGTTALKLTTAKYFTPSGQSIDGVGITPDVPINQTMLSQTNKPVIMKNEQAMSIHQLTSDSLFDQPLVKAKQLLSMQ